MRALYPSGWRKGRAAGEDAPAADQRVEQPGEPPRPSSSTSPAWARTLCRALSLFTTSTVEPIGAARTWGTNRHCCWSSFSLAGLKSLGRGTWGSQTTAFFTPESLETISDSSVLLLPH